MAVELTSNIAKSSKGMPLEINFVLHKHGSGKGGKGASFVNLSVGEMQDIISDFNKHMEEYQASIDRYNEKQHSKKVRQGDEQL